VRAKGRSPCPLEPGARVGPYEVLEELASGDSGCLHRARRGKRTYALRMARRRLSELAPADRERMARELPLWRSLRHPNLVRIRSLERFPDAPDGYPCLVTDPWAGEPLRDWCERERPPGAAVAAVFERIASALARLHRRGLVHRGLRSEAVVVREGVDPLVVDPGMADFGPTRRGRGRAPRRSPEPGRQGELFAWRPADDLRALGAMLHEALGGEAPDRTRPGAKMQAAGGSLPDELRELVHRLLASDPARRPASAAEVARALARASRVSPPRRTPVATALPPPRPEEGDTLTGPTGRDRKGSVAAQPVEPGGERATGFDAPTLRVASPFDEGTGAAAEAPGAPGPEETPAAIREVKARLAAAAPRKPRSSLALAAGAVGLSAAGAIAALVATGPRAAERPAPWDGTGRAAAPVGYLPEAPPGGLAAAPGDGRARPSSEGRAVDEELEREFGRPTVTPDGGIESARLPAPRPEPEGAPAATAGPSPWLLRSQRREAAAAAAGPRQRGVPIGLHLRARLLTNLDSRTIGNGPVEAVLQRPALARGGMVLPEGTLAFGAAAESSGRFTIHFTRLRLPDESEVSFDGIAMAREDGKPGLPATLAIQGAVERGPGAVAEMAREPAGLLLDSVSTGPVNSLARKAGEKAFERGPSPAALGRALLLDAGVPFDIWVERSF